MGLFVTEKSNFKVYVSYVFDEEKEIHIISDEDVEKINNGYSGEELSEDGYPFNERVSLKSYKKEDVKTATFIFRKPSFSDMPELLDGIGVDMKVGDAVAFNTRRMNYLFVSGTAQDSKGRIAKIDDTNLGELDPALGSSVTLALTEAIG